MREAKSAVTEVKINGILRYRVSYAKKSGQVIQTNEFNRGL